MFYRPKTSTTGCLSPRRVFIRYWLCPLFLAAIWLHPDAATAADGKRQVGSSDTVKCTLPMLYNPPTLPLPVVSIRIGGSKPLLFLVDTGSNATMTLAHWASEEIHPDRLANGVRSDKSIDGKTYDEYHFEPTLLCIVDGVPGSTNLGINLADIECARDDLEITDGNFKTPHLAGVIGINFWSNFTLQFDFARRTLGVFVEHPSWVNGGTASTQPLTVDNPAAAAALALRPWPGFEPIPQIRLSDPHTTDRGALTTDGSSTNPLPSDLWLVIDTGSDATDLPDTLRRTSGDSDRIGSMVHQHNQRVVVHEENLNSLTLDGQLTEPDVIVNWFRGPLTPNLGMNFLRRFLVTLDTKNEKLYLQRASNYADASHGSSFLGFALRRDLDGHLRVSRIFDEGSARRANIHVGDEVVEIDGYDLGRYSHYQVSALEDGVAGTASCLMIRRKGAAAVTAVWITRSDPLAARATKDAAAAPALIQLTGRTLCKVTYADGRTTQMPFRCNPEAEPPADAPDGSYYQRVQLASGAFGWAIIPSK